MKFKYIERCAKGFVEFVTKDGNIVMETGVAVEVPDSLAAKLKNNSHFERVPSADDEVEFSDNTGEIGVGIGHHETMTVKRRGRPPKAQPE